MCPAIAATILSCLTFLVAATAITLWYTNFAVDAGEPLGEGESKQISPAWPIVIAITHAFTIVNLIITLVRTRKYSGYNIVSMRDMNVNDGGESLSNQSIPLSPVQQYYK